MSDLCVLLYWNTAVDEGGVWIPPLLWVAAVAGEKATKVFRADKRERGKLQKDNWKINISLSYLK